MVVRGRAEDFVGNPPTIFGGAPDVDAVMEDTGLRLDLNGGHAGCFRTRNCDVEDEFLRFGPCLAFNLVSASNFLFLLASSSVWQVTISTLCHTGSSVKSPETW